MSINLSYAHGISDIPLKGETIGQNLRQMFNNDGLFWIGTVGFKLFQHAYIVCFPEVGRGYQKVYAALFQCITKSWQFVSRIDVYHNGSHQGCGVLHNDPFIPVWRPYSYPFFCRMGTLIKS